MHDASPSTEALEERRRIVDAAWRVLARSGFQGLKVGSVVRAVPTSTRAFYRWFADKDDLVVELVCQEYLRAGRRLAAAMEDQSPEVAVRRWIEGYLRAATEPTLAVRARLFSSLRGAAPRGTTRTAEALDRFLAPLRQKLAEGRCAGVFTTDDPRGDAISIHHLCAGALLDALQGDDDRERTRATIDRVTRFSLRALGVGDR